MLHFVQLLNNEDVSVEEVAEEFLKIFRNSRDEGTADFVELLFHAGGWTSFVYLGSAFPQKQQFDEIKAHGVNDIFPPVSNKDIDFQKRFSEFFTHILESNKCYLMYDDQFMYVVVKAFQILSSGKWDMFRLIAQLLGMRMMYSLNKEYEKLKSHYVSDLSNPLALTRIHRNSVGNTAYQTWKQTFFKIYHLVQCYVYRSLCECQETVTHGGSVEIISSPYWITNLLNELMVCTHLSPTTAFKDRWMALILNGLREKNMEHKGLCHMVMYLLLCRHIDTRWQIKLFNYVKSDLFYSLRMHSEMALISMRIIASAIRLKYPKLRTIEIDLTSSDLETIYFYLYDSDQTMALLAAEFVFTAQFTDLIRDPTLVITQLIEVNRDSYMKCEELLIDAMYYNIKNHITWSSWMKVLTECNEDDITDLMIMLYAFVRKATTGFIPRLRTKVVKEMSSHRIIENRCDYTIFFLKHWFVLLELNKITGKPKALSKLIKLIQYFDEGIISSEGEIICDLAKVCLAYIRVGDDSNLAEECCRSLSKLKDYSKNSLRVYQTVELIMNSAVKLIFKDFNKFKTNVLVRLTQSQMLSATKFLDVDDLVLWEVSMEKLRIASVQRVNQNLIKTLICLLFQLLMRRARCTLHELNETKSKSLGMVNILVSNCLSQSIALQSVVRVFLGPNFRPDVRKAAFSTLLDLLEFLGPHLTPPEGIWFPKTSLDDDDVYKLVTYTKEMMESSKSCQANHISHARLEDCCSVVYKLCIFISRGLLDVQCITPLVRHLGKNHIHDDIVVESINKYTNAFPQNWEILSNTIFNSYALLKDEYIPNDIPLQDTAEIRESVSKLYSELMTLSQVLTRRLKFSDLRTMRKVSIRLHTVLIDQALKPTGYRPLIELLYAIRELLANEDVQFILSCLEEYHIEGNTDVGKYYNYLKQNAVLRPDNNLLVKSHASIALPVVYD